MIAEEIRKEKTNMQNTEQQTPEEAGRQETPEETGRQENIYDRIRKLPLDLKIYFTHYIKPDLDRRMDKEIIYGKHEKGIAELCGKLPNRKFNQEKYDNAIKCLRDWLNSK